MKSHFIFLIPLIVFAQGCSTRTHTAQDDVQFSLNNCDRDNFICPDGSIVMRIPPDCDFEACPEVKYDKCSDPKREYWKHDTRECPYIALQCESGLKKFDDECGCGCEP